MRPALDSELNFLRLAHVEVVLGDALVLRACTPASKAKGSRRLHLHLQKEGSVVFMGVVTQM